VSKSFYRIQTRMFDTDDVALGADLCLKSLQTQPGAAPDIQNGVARPEGKPFDRQEADLFERGKFQIVGRRARLVLRDRGLSVWASPQRSQGPSGFAS